MNSKVTRWIKLMVLCNVFCNTYMFCIIRGWELWRSSAQLICLCTCCVSHGSVLTQLKPEIRQDLCLLLFAVTVPTPLVFHHFWGHFFSNILLWWGNLLEKKVVGSDDNCHIIDDKNCSLTGWRCVNSTQGGSVVEQASLKKVGNSFKYLKILLLWPI